MSDKTKKSIVIQGSILALAGIVTKIIGFVYRIPMANIMGNEGNGLYSIAFGIYGTALTLSSYSMPLAVSKLMSERIVKGQYKDADRLFKRALIFATCTGLIAFLVLFIFPEFFANYIYKREGLERPLRVLAPTTFVVALLGTCRGYFQGHRNMVPTAFSQIIEQIVNAIISVVATAAFVNSCSDESIKGSMGAMGGTFGTLAGATSALLIFVGLFIIGRKTRKQELSGDDEVTEDNALIFKCIILTVIPVIISQTIYQISYTLDDIIYGNLMALKGIERIHATSMQGVFNTQYNQMINLPVAVATAMASATLPSVVASYTVKDFDGVKKKIDIVLLTNMLIAIPSCIGLAVLAEPIMGILFPRLNEYHDMAVILLRAGSSAVIFYVLSTFTTSVLQGCNKMRVPVEHSGISLIIHIVMVASLLYYTDLGVYALVIGNITFPMVVSLLNIRSVKKLIDYKFDFMKVFFKPLLSAIVMGAVAAAVYYVPLNIMGSQSFGLKIVLLAASVIVAVLVYGMMLLATKTLSKDELKKMPVIKKLVK